MKIRVGLGVVACLAAFAISDFADADAAARKRNPKVFDVSVGGKSANNSVMRRQLMRQAERNGVAGPLKLPNLSLERAAKPPKSAKAAKAAKPSKTTKIARSAGDNDPEPDPGFGMGNLTYIPPRLVPLSGLALPEPRPAGTAEAMIYDSLAGDGSSIRVLPATRDALLAHYVAQGFKPVWLEDGKLNARGVAVLAQLAAADQEGLDPQNYLPTGLESFSSTLPETDSAAMARLDIDLTAAALRYARDASGGQFDPRLLSSYNDIDPPWIAPEKALKVIAWSPYPVEYLKSLNPTHPAYAAMRNALAGLRAKETGAPFEPIAAGPVVGPGKSDPRIPALRQRLAERGYASGQPAVSDAALFDQPLSDELRRFQKDSRIRVTGLLGPQTLRALNENSSASNIDRLRTNMERLRWLPRDLGKRYVFVNPPAYEAKVIDHGEDVWATRVIVGKPDTQTAAFHDEMEFLVFNPSWGVPQSIILKEYLPRLRRDPGYLDRIGFQVVNQQGKVVPSRSVKWWGFGQSVPYGILQPPGDKNALGEIKFMFPNSHDIYMHDTPNRDLFDNETRAFSHGCVRVQNPREFAAVVLGWSAEEVDSHIATAESETVRLEHKLPVHIGYFTAWPDSQGNMRYFNDIYGRDKAMETARSATLVAQN